MTLPETSSLPTWRRLPLDWLHFQGTRREWYEAQVKLDGEWQQMDQHLYEEDENKARALKAGCATHELRVLKHTVEVIDGEPEPEEVEYDCPRCCEQYTLE